MIVSRAGEVIADILSISPTLAEIPSASAILDTSNFTFQAVSFGKDANGFKYHAHTVIQPSATVSFKVFNYDVAPSQSYQTSTTASALKDLGYNFYVGYPDIKDTRLEFRSTATNISATLTNIGHCMNSIISPTLSSMAHLIGCYPASGGTNYYVLSSLSATYLANPNVVAYSGTLSSTYNKYGIMDSNGFLKFAPLGISQGTAPAGNITGNDGYTSGCLLSGTSNFNTAEGFVVAVQLPSGDAGALCLFGGVYHVGLWCLDLRAMLDAGNNPPYTWNTTNGIRKYRLFAKKTFSKDLTYLKNYGSTNAFKTIFSGSSPLDSNGIFIRFKVRFV